MPESSWLESRKKSRRFIVFLFIVVIAGGLSVFFYNNRELFFTKQSPTSHPANARTANAEKTNVPAPPDEKQEARKAVVAKSGADTVIRANGVGTKQEKQVERSSPGVAQLGSGILLSDFDCGLGGREAMKVFISLEVFVSSERLKKEVLLKRDDLKVMVRKVMSGKNLEDLIIDSLRSQTKIAMNRILENGAVDDVIFRNFRIEKVK
jgi:flagellar basal body-associated protein FliL